MTTVVARYVLLRELGAREVATHAARLEGGGEAAEIVVIERYPGYDDALKAARAAEPLTKLVAPNLARLRAVLASGTDIVIVSELVEGETYADLTRGTDDAFADMPFRIRVRIVVDVLAGLSALQGDSAARRIHGGVAPMNIVLGVDGRTRLIRACNLFPEKVSPASPTLSYVAPEVFTRKGTLGPQVDLFGVGVLLWEALCGRRPKLQTNAPGLLLQELEGAPPRGIPASDLPWAKGLIAITQRALAGSEERFATAAEMAAAIRLVAQARLAPIEEVAAFVERSAGVKISERRRSLEAMPADEMLEASALPARKLSLRAPPPEVIEERAAAKDRGEDAGVDPERASPAKTSGAARPASRSRLLTWGAVGCGIGIALLAGYRLGTREPKTKLPLTTSTAASPSPPASSERSAPPPEGASEGASEIELGPDVPGAPPKPAPRARTKPPPPVPPPAASERKKFDPQAI